MTRRPRPDIVSSALRLAVALTAIGALAGSARAVEPCQGAFAAMGGIPVRLTAHGLDPAACAPLMDGIEAELRALERAMSTHRRDGALAMLNRGAHRGGPCPAALATVLRASLEVARDTGGAFDVTVGPLVRLWRDAGAQGRLPGDAELAAARAAVGHDAVHVDGGRLRIDRLGVRVDLGGIAKGHFGDVAIARMRAAGATRCLADVGADLVSWRVEDEAEFVVGVRNPWGDGLLGVLTVPGGAVVTSGDYERFVTIDGTRYAHIVDPRDGRPVTGTHSVTVLAPTGIEADALATGIFVLGYDEGSALVAAREGLEALIVADTLDGGEQRVYLSEGLVDRFEWSTDVLAPGAE